MNNVVTKYGCTHIVMQLAEITGESGFQYLLNRLLGLSSERIDKLILKERCLEQQRGL